MQLSREATEEIKKIYFQEYGAELSVEEFEKCASSMSAIAELALDSYFEKEYTKDVDPIAE